MKTKQETFIHSFACILPLRSWSINNLGVRIAKRDFNPGFFVDHFVKDMVRRRNSSCCVVLSTGGMEEGVG